MFQQLLNEIDCSLLVDEHQKADKNLNILLAEQIKHCNDPIGYGFTLFIWNGQIWMEDDDGLAILVQEVYKKVNARYSKVQFDEVKRILIQRSHIEARELNRCKTHIPFKNGEYNIATKQVEPFDSSHLFTYQLQFDSSFVGKCPVFLNYLATCIPDQAIRDKLCIFAAYMLTNRIDLQKACILYGVGGSGKSIFLSIMNKIFEVGDLASGVALQYLGDRFNKILYAGKLANIYDDLTEADLVTDSFFKILTGFEYIKDAEFKGLNERIKYRNTVKLLFSCNLLPFPRFDALSPFFQRWIIIPFLNTFRGTDKENHSLLDELESELNAIVVYFLSFLPRLDELRATTEEATRKTWMMYSSSVVSYLEQSQRDDSYVAICSDYYEQYLAYCRKEKLVSVSYKKFGSTLQEQGISRVQRTVYKTLSEKSIEWVYLGVMITVQ